jgi:hypothetical protein
LFKARGEDGFDIASLRQGDILEGIPFPLLDSTKMLILGEIPDDSDFGSIPAITPRLHPHRDDHEWTTGQAPIRFGFCAVLSNCCDLELRGGRIQAHSIVLARLRPIPPDVRNDIERFNSLKANKDPRNRDDAGYIDYFYLEPHEKLSDKDWKVHFNLVLSLPTADLTGLLRKKVLQLEDRTRMKFKIKLGFTYMRANREELDAGLENPWQ